MSDLILCWDPQSVGNNLLSNIFLESQPITNVNLTLPNKRVPLRILWKIHQDGPNMLNWRIDDDASVCGEDTRIGRWQVGRRGLRKHCCNGKYHRNDSATYHGG